METARLLSAQAGVATLRQLVDAGVPPDHVRAQVEAQRWQRFGDRCILTHNFEPTRLQAMWLATLDPRQPVAVAGLTSLETAGFKFFGSETTWIHIVVQRGAKTWRLPDVKVHESRRFFMEDIDPKAALPRTYLPRSALDAAAWQPFPRYACGLLAAVVQQRICKASDLADELKFIGRIRHKAHMRLAIHDIAGGAEALSELDLAGLCRQFGLVPPNRQRIRKDRHGRKRYLDAEWDLPDGTIVVLEVDGSHHMEVENWEADMKRERGVVIGGRRVLRASANEVRLEASAVADDLRAIGVPTLP